MNTRTIERIERRAAEIIAAINCEYVTGGWFAGMSASERAGWDKAEDEWWNGRGEYDSRSVPSNAGEWAGWLAFNAYSDPWGVHDGPRDQEALPAPVIECIRDGEHLRSCDDDGYCNACGYQEGA